MMAPFKYQSFSVGNSLLLNAFRSTLARWKSLTFDNKESNTVE